MTAPATRPLRIGTAVRRSVKGLRGYEQYGVETSPERRQYDILDWIKRNAPGGTVVAEYEEDGYSAWEVDGEPRRKRPEFERQIRDIEAGRLDLLVLWKVDRSNRGYTNGGRLWRACQRTNTRLVFVNDGLDSDHPMFEQMYFWMLGVAKEYSNRISAGLRQYREALKRAGLRAPTRRRFGWAPDGLTPLWGDGQLTWTVRRKPPEGGLPVPVEVTFEPEADYLRAAGEQLTVHKSTGLVIREWNASDIFSPYGHRWVHSTVRKVFSAPYNELIFGSEPYADIQTILDDPERRKYHRGSTRAHLQTGRIDCGDCGWGLKGHVGQADRAAGKAHYKCVNPGCRKIYRLTGPVDAILLDDLVYRLHCRQVERALASASADGQHRDLPAERQSAKARYDQLADELAELEADSEYESDLQKQAKADVKTRAMARLTATMREIDHLIREHNEQIHDEAVVEEAIKLGSALRAWWPTRTPEQQRELLEAAGWERTVMHPGKPLARYLDPLTVERHWRKRDGELEIIFGPSPGALPLEPRPRCSVDDCDEPRHGRKDWCKIHYHRQLRTGDPLGLQRSPRLPCSVDGCDRLRYGRKDCAGCTTGAGSGPAIPLGSTP